MWLKEEGIPVIGGWAVQDLKKVPLSPWPRTGGLGVYVNLTGSEEQTGAYICEVPVGQSLRAEKHMYEELIYIATGAGTCTVWGGGADREKAPLEGPGASVFAPPLNTWHQFTNTSNVPARFFALTSARVHMNLFHNKEFIFNNKFVFTDRFNSQRNYFNGDG